ncbi:MULTISPECIES: hypothetical protein [unclassified Streptomyces]
MITGGEGSGTVGERRPHTNSAIKELIVIEINEKDLSTASGGGRAWIQ